MYEIVLSKKVEKFLDKQNNKTVEKFAKSALQLSKNPFENNTLDIKKLIGNEPNHFRLRINKIRFIYNIIEEQKIILFYNAGYRAMSLS